MVERLLQEKRHSLGLTARKLVLILSLLKSSTYSLANMFTRLSMLLFTAIITTCFQLAQATQNANALVGLPRPDTTERTSPLDVDRLSSVLPIHDHNASASLSSKALAELKSRAFGQQQRNGNCPAIWERIAADLKLDFLGCNDHARSAVRFAFHDAGKKTDKATILLKQVKLTRHI